MLFYVFIQDLGGRTAKFVNPRPNTTEMGSCTNNKPKCKGLLTPTKGWGVHDDVVISVLSRFSSHYSPGSHNLGEQLLIVTINTINLINPSNHFSSFIRIMQ